MRCRRAGELPCHCHARLEKREARQDGFVRLAPVCLWTKRAPQRRQDRFAHGQARDGNFERMRAGHAERIRHEFLREVLDEMFPATIEQM